MLGERAVMVDQLNGDEMKTLRLLALGGFLAFGQTAHGFVWTVDSPDDTDLSLTPGNKSTDTYKKGQCTFRKAMLNVHAHHVAGDGKPHFHVDCPPSGPNAYVDEIRFSEDVGAVFLVHGVIDIDGKRELIISGHKGDPVQISGTQQDRILRILAGEANADVTINDIEFVDGKTSGAGGAIEQGSASSKLTINGGGFTDNIAASSGGAIQSAGLLTIVRTDFTRNIAQPDVPGGISRGGAVFSSGQLDMTGLGEGFFMYNDANQGGAVYIASGKALIKSYEFSRNRSMRFPGQTSGVPNMGGGAVFNYGGVFHGAALRIDENRAQNGLGGAIYAGSAGKTQLDLTAFSRNSSYCMNPMKDEACGGGCIFANGQLEVLRTSFNGCLSGAQGGAIFSRNTSDKPTAIANSTFTENQAREVSTSEFEGVTVFGPLVNGARYEGGAVAIKGTANARIVNNTFVDDQGSSVLSVLKDPAVGSPVATIGNNILLVGDGADVGCSFDPTNVPSYLSFVSNYEYFVSASNVPTCPVGVIANASLSGPYPVSGYSGTEFYVPLMPNLVPGDSSICADPPVDGVDIRGKTRALPCIAGSWQ